MSTLFDLSLGELRERRSAKWTTYGPDVLPLPVAEMDVHLAAPVAATLRAAVERSDTGYAGDLTPMVEAFAGFAQRRWGWTVDPAGVRACADVASGVTDTLRAAIGPGDEVVLMPPLYPPSWRWVRWAGGRVVEVPLLDLAGGGRIDLDGVEAALAAGARAVLLCHPHNPTGRVHAPAELRALAALAARHGATVVSDEVHGPLAPAGFQPYLGVSDEAAATGVAVTSASKAWNLAGLKCALVVAAAAPGRALLDAVPPEASWGVGQLGVLAGEAAWVHGDAWLDLLLESVAQNVRLLDDLLDAALPRLRWSPPEAGYLGWLDCRALRLGDDPSASFLAGGVALGRGPDFGPPGAGHVRLNLACSPDLLVEAVGRMAAVAASVT